MDTDRLRDYRIILLDTNFIMLPFQFNIDITTELPGKTLATITPVMEELEKIPRGKAGKQLVEQKNIKILKTTGYADEALIRTAEKEKAAIATNDAELKEKCIKRNIPVITMKGKSKLVII